LQWGRTYTSLILANENTNIESLSHEIIRQALPDRVKDVDIHEYDPIARGEPDDSFDWSLFDVLILDHYLCVHGLTGLDLFQKHQKTPGFPPTIMLTAAGNEGLAVRAFKSGIKDYIRKDDMDVTVMSEAIRKAYEKHHTHQDGQLELHIMNKQLRKQRVELEEQAAVISAELENIEIVKQGNQEGVAEVEQMKTEAEAHLRKQRVELQEQAANMKAQLENIEIVKQGNQEGVAEVEQMKTKAEAHLRKQRVELQEQAANMKAQLQKQRAGLHEQAATVKAQLQKMAEEKHVQLEKQRAELHEQAAAVKVQLQKMAEELHGQQDTVDTIQKLDSEAEAQIQKEHSELTKEVNVFKEKLIKVVKAYKKIRKERERLLQDKTKAEAERQQHTEEMAKANNEIENTNKALTDAEAKLKISEDEKQKLSTEYKQQLDKAKVEEDVSPPKEIETGEEILDSTQLGAAMDLDELLDTDEEPHKQSDSGVKDRPDNGKS